MKKSHFLVLSLIICTPLILGSPVEAKQITAHCKIDGLLQDKACTPGAVFTKVTTKTICKAGYTKKVRNVSNAVRNKVFTEYGITYHPAGAYEVDHLIPLELGGSNDIANLWPEAASPKPGFHQKDKVENYLHKQVCTGKMSLEDAQKSISNDWTVWIK